MRLIVDSPALEVSNKAARKVSVHESAVHIVHGAVRVARNEVTDRRDKAVDINDGSLSGKSVQRICIRNVRKTTDHGCTDITAGIAVSGRGLD